MLSIMKTEKKIFDKKYQQQRDDLAGEHHLGDLLQLILLFCFLGVWISDSFFLRYSLLAPGSGSLFIRIPVGLVILGIAWFLARSGLKIVFGPERSVPGVIRDGVFGRTRHPIYLGAILLYLGLLVFSLSIAAAIVWGIIIIFYILIARFEEKQLIERFGAEYEEYMQAVPMMIPRLKKK